MSLAEAVQVDEEALERVDATALAAPHPELEHVELVDQVVDLGQPHRRQVDEEPAPEDALQELSPAHGLRGGVGGLFRVKNMCMAMVKLSLAHTVLLIIISF